MDNKELNVRMSKVMSAYEAMNNAVPDGVSLKETMSAAVLLIANCIVQGKLSEDEEEVLCDHLGEKIRGAIEIVKEATK
jgi:hypothetical protein